MPKGELFINGKDAYTTWGVSMNSSALSALMTPPAVKAYVENDNRTQHGKRVLISNVRMAARDLVLTFYITASSESEFMRRYADFVSVLAQGVLEISTKYQPYVFYRCIYQSCSQFSEYSRGMAMFTLRLTEPNPDNRKIVIVDEPEPASEEGGEL